MAKNVLMTILCFSLCWVLACSSLQNSNASTFDFMQATNGSSSSSSGNSSGSSIRGRGTHTGSGSSTGGGILPLCTDCFGHGVNPSIDPRCRIGCRGGGRSTGLGSSSSLFPTTAARFAFANFGSDSQPNMPKHMKQQDPKEKAAENRKSRSSKHGKTRKSWIVVGGVFLLLLAALVLLAYCKTKFKKRQARVGVTVTFNNQLPNSETI